MRKRKETTKLAYYINNVLPVKKELSKVQPTDVLPVGTLKCPTCKQPLEFKQIHGIRLVENGLLEARCQNDNKYFDVKAKP